MGGGARGTREDRLRRVRCRLWAAGHRDVQGFSELVDTALQLLVVRLYHPPGRGDVIVALYAAPQDFGAGFAIGLASPETA